MTWSSYGTDLGVPLKILVFLSFPQHPSNKEEQGIETAAK
jgi:hypothetical protein